MTLRHTLLCAGLLLFAAPIAHAAELDLSQAVIWAHDDDLRPMTERKAVRKAVQMLVEEVEKRTGVRWAVVATHPDPSTDYIAVAVTDALPDSVPGADDWKPESLSIDVTGRSVRCVGKDSRGVLYAAGRLLRELRMSPGQITLDRDFKFTSTPQTKLRGHQLGYRPKTNSYDAWDVPMWEQYIRDLVVFGNNAIELIPPRSDDDDESPHFPLPKLEMMVEMSRICDEYDQDVWIWYPAMDEDYADPATVEFALKEWAEVFQKLPRIDAVFVPGGDPGHTHPQPLMAMLEKQAASLKTFHPNAQMWMSPQSFSDEWMEIFLKDLNREQPDWLAGIVFGPQVWTPLPVLRKAVPAKYPIRDYPDITHSRHCQYPVPDWDLAYALTEGRESINPRPVAHANIYRRTHESTVGFITYSEGCNDDVNKIVWSTLGWDKDTPVIDIVRQYARYFIGPDIEEGFAQGLLALEQNWRGPLLTNAGVYTTLAQFQDMERAASPERRKNWRFQQALYRAYYDAYVRRRLIAETAAEEEVMDTLRDAKLVGSLRAIDVASLGLTDPLNDLLDDPPTDALNNFFGADAVDLPPATNWRKRVFQLADALYHSIRMQLSVPLYKAIATERGANLDMIDHPLNNRPWLQRRFAAIREIDNEQERLAEIDKIINWTNPGPGGFYDDLGNPSNQPHLVRGPGAELDPQHFESALLGTSVRNGIPPVHPITWWTHAESMHNAPLTMQYDDLDPTATYKLRVNYMGDMPPVKIRLTADEDTEIHPLIDKSMPEPIFEFDIPAEVTSDGQLTLTWHREPGLGRNGRGCQVSEVWLMRQ